MADFSELEDGKRKRVGQLLKYKDVLKHPNGSSRLPSVMIKTKDFENERCSELDLSETNRKLQHWRWSIIIFKKCAHMPAKREDLHTLSSWPKLIGRIYLDNIDVDIF